MELSFRDGRHGVFQSNALWSVTERSLDLTWSGEEFSDSVTSVECYVVISKDFHGLFVSLQILFPPCVTPFGHSCRLVLPKGGKKSIRLPVSHDSARFGPGYPGILPLSLYCQEHQLMHHSILITPCSPSTGTSNARSYTCSTASVTSNAKPASRAFDVLSCIRRQGTSRSTSKYTNIALPAASCTRCVGIDIHRTRRRETDLGPDARRCALVSDGVSAEEFVHFALIPCVERWPIVDFIAPMLVMDGLVNRQVAETGIYGYDQG